MFSIYLHMFSMLLIIIGAINYGLMGLFNINLLEKVSINSNVLMVIYIIIGLCGLYLSLDKTSYLPFLGQTVLPYNMFHEVYNKDAEKVIKLKVDCPKAKKVIYWSSVKNINDIPMDVYKAYKISSNHGVSNIENNEATLYVDCPQEYFVKKFGLFNSNIPKHLHYRYIYDNNMLSEVKTMDLEYC